MDGWTSPNDAGTQQVGGTYPADGQISADDWSIYWDQVERTLQEVFEVQNPEDNDRLKRLKANANDTRNPSFGATVFHLDPFQVAADLADIERVTHDHKEKYGKVLKSIASSSAPPRYSLNLLHEVLADQTRADAPDDAIPRTAPV